MNRTIIFAGALLAFTGAPLSQAFAALPYANPAFRPATAYRAPVARAPQARMSWTRASWGRTSWNRTAWARPSWSRAAWGRTSWTQAHGFRAPARTAWHVPYRPALGSRYRPALASAPAVRPAYGYRRLAQPANGRAYGYRVAHRFGQPAYGRLAYRVYNRIAQPALAAPAVATPSQSAAFGAPAVVLPAPAVKRVAVAPTAVAPRLATAPAAGTQVGGASYYSGGRTASGGFVGAATCAHRSLPFGTRVLVTNMSNARSTVCVVNDRGPFIGGRIVDLSRGAAGAIGMLGAGVAPVRLQVMGRS